MAVTLEIPRLIPRPPRIEDIGQFVPLLGDFEVSKNLSTVPPPYTEEDGRTFIALVSAGWYYDNTASGRVLEKLGFMADGSEERPCLSRGGKVFCHKVLLKRADYMRRKELR